MSIKAALNSQITIAELQKLLIEQKNTIEQLEAQIEAQNEEREVEKKKIGYRLREIRIPILEKFKEDKRSLNNFLI